MKTYITRQEIRELRSRLNDAGCLIDDFKAKMIEGPIEQHDDAMCRKAGELSRAISDLLYRTA